jgi:hypothetical protein
VIMNLLRVREFAEFDWFRYFHEGQIHLHKACFELPVRIAVSLLHFARNGGIILKCTLVTIGPWKTRQKS